MTTQRRKKGSFSEGTEMPRRSRVKFTAAKSTGAKRVSFLKGKKSPRRSRVTYMARRSARVRSH